MRMKTDRQGTLASRLQQHDAQLAEHLANCWLLHTCRILLLIIAAVASISTGACQSSGELQGDQAFSCACSCSIVGALWRLAMHCVTMSAPASSAVSLTHCSWGTAIQQAQPVSPLCPSQAVLLHPAAAQITAPRQRTRQARRTRHTPPAATPQRHPLPYPPQRRPPQRH